ncbi:MAG: WYL domain-containing protein, partial [Lachnospiraceae bacterium]
PAKIEMLRKTEKVFRLGCVPQQNHCELLKDILQSAIEEKVCAISYLKNGSQHDYTVQFFDISASFGQWYATGYHFEAARTQVFRCDKMISIKECEKYVAKPFADFAKSAKMLYKTETATDFDVEVSPKGVDLFQKEHYPSMRLETENGQYFIRGFYNQGEEHFIATYFLGYGENILSVKPAALSKQILERLATLQQYFERIL